jgi:metal-sulfur cluster biosynthetic enzyme
VAHGAPVTEREAWEALGGVLDPELGVDIVELGLVYGLTVTPSRIDVTMTLTTPGCPLHDALVGGVERALTRDGGPAVAVEVVWDPPWTPERIGAMGRRFIAGARAPS